MLQINKYIRNLKSPRHTVRSESLREAVRGVASSNAYVFVKTQRRSFKVTEFDFIVKFTSIITLHSFFSGQKNFQNLYFLVIYLMSNIPHRLALLCAMTGLFHRISPLCGVVTLNLLICNIEI